MSALLKKLWENTFHIEGRFLRTCWQLFIPGKITQEFFKGKLERYPPPLHMIAVVMFLFLFILNHTLLESQKSKSSKQGYSLTTTAHTEHGDSVISKTGIPTYERWKRQVALEDMRSDYESMPESWQTPAARKVVDSLLRAYNIRNGLEDLPGLPDTLNRDYDTTNINILGAKGIHLATSDLVRYEPDELIERYHINEWYLKLILKQSIKSFSDPKALTHAYLGSLTWAILVLSALMSAVLTLMYRRQKRYYVEHFIFMIHFHSGLMLALSLVMLGHWLKLFSPVMYGILFLWISYAMYSAMKRYYGQGTGKTLLKWFIFGVVYYACFTFLFVTGLIVVFAIF